MHQEPAQCPPRIQIEALAEFVDVGLFEVSCLRLDNKAKLMDWLLYHVEGGSNEALGEGPQEASWQADGGDITGSVLIYLP